MKDNKSHMSVENVKNTMEALDRLAQENGTQKGGHEILEDTASLILDIPASIRILVFQIKCKIKAKYNIFKFRVRKFLTTK